MLLHPEESVRRSAYAVLDGDDVHASVRGPGVLYLTTHRLIFESPASRGLVRDLLGGRESQTVLDVGLAEVRNVAVRRGRLGRTRLVVEIGHGRPSFDVLEPEVWAGAIGQARRSLPPPGRAPTLVVERQVVKVRCRYCGSLGDEVVGRCPSCGAAL